MLARVAVPRASHGGRTAGALLPEGEKRSCGMRKEGRLVTCIKKKSDAGGGGITTLEDIIQFKLKYGVFWGEK